MHPFATVGVILIKELIVIVQPYAHVLFPPSGRTSCCVLHFGGLLSIDLVVRLYNIGQ